MPNFAEIDEGKNQDQQQQSTIVRHLTAATSISHIEGREFDGVVETIQGSFRHA